MALQPWSQRCAQDAHAPQRMAALVPDATIGGNSPGVVYGVIEDTPGNTPMNRAKGAVRQYAGNASQTGQDENPYTWINSSSLFQYLGQMDPTNG